MCAHFCSQRHIARGVLIRGGLKSAAVQSLVLPIRFSRSQHRVRNTSAAKLCGATPARGYAGGHYEKLWFYQTRQKFIFFFVYKYILMVLMLLNHRGIKSELPVKVASFFSLSSAASSFLS